MILPPLTQILAFAHNHVLLFVALAVVILAFIANEAHGRLTGGPRLAIPDAVRMINDRSPLVIDVRSAAEFKKGHMLGAVSVPAAKVKERGSQFDKDLERPVIVYCNLGGSSVEVAKGLRARGHKEVYVLKGGINAWQNSNLPVTAK
ncbi:MAG TPA: rhodanese-like domain-containing protein [Nevskiaceae bacterium]|nr:rhodanese-like domain-containing protein [Nevskiaceae bacterium]